MYINLPVTLTPNKLKSDLAKAFATKVKTELFGVYENGVLLNGSPFSSFASAMVAAGYSKTSIAGRRSIDTGKLIGGRFTFYSKPLL